MSEIPIPIFPMEIPIARIGEIGEGDSCIGIGLGDRSSGKISMRRGIYRHLTGYGVGAAME